MSEQGPVDADGDGFIYFSLEGDRFNAPGMPAESVVEIQRLNELIYEVARGVWLERNQDRQRVPSEFVAALDLRLVSIREGSALPVLRLHQRPGRTPDEEDYTPIFASARDLIVESITQVADVRELPPRFPRSAVPALRRVGKTLEGRESMTIGEPRRSGRSGDRPLARATLTPEIHSVIAQIDAALDNEPGPQDLEGVVTELDGYKGTFELRDSDGRTHVCRLAYHEREVAKAVKTALAPDGITAPDVVVSGIGLTDAKGRVGELWDVHSVRVVRPYTEKALMTKLSALRELKDEWWGPGSVRPDAEALAKLGEALPVLGRLEQVIAIGANSEGAVVLEWGSGAVEYTAHLEPNGDLFLCADNTETDELTESQRPYTQESLIRFVENGVVDA